MAEMAYQELGLRESSDIDFLIKRRDFEKIKKLFLKEGYRPSFKLAPIVNNLFFSFYGEYNFDLYESGVIQNRSTRQIHLEPHWVLGNKMYQTYIDYGAILPLTAKGILLNNAINQLSPEGLLITTAAHHGASDRWLHLKTIVDIAVILLSYKIAYSFKSFSIKSPMLGMGMVMERFIK